MIYLTIDQSVCISVSQPVSFCRSIGPSVSQSAYDVSVCISISLSVCLSVSLWCICPYIDHSVCLSISQLINVSVYISTIPSVCQSVDISCIYLSIDQFACLSVNQPLQEVHVAISRQHSWYWWTPVAGLSVPCRRPALSLQTLCLVTIANDGRKAACFSCSSNL